MTQWEECPEPKTPEPGDREYREDFDTETHETEGTSIDLRPDAISVDHQTAFTLGPIAIADPSQGLLVRVWRVRYDGEVVWITPARMDNGSWLTEIALFSVQDGLGPLTEIDFAFEQTGNPVVCAERPTGPDGSPEIWIYFYDPTIPGQVFRNFGTGRTPRALLDRPLEIADSDVCVFYIDDERSQLVYRQQRERYEVVYETPVRTDENTFVEDVAKRDDRRVVVLYSQRDPDTGRYELRQLTSLLPPITIDVEVLRTSQALTRVSLEQVVIDAPATDTELVYVSHSLYGIVVESLIIFYDSPFSIESLHSSQALLGVSLRSVVLEYNESPTETLFTSHELSGMNVELAITIDREMEMEMLHVSQTLLGVSLEVV